MHQRIEFRSGPPKIGGDDLLRERLAHRGEIDAPPDLGDIVALDRSNESVEIVERPGRMAEHDQPEHDDGHDGRDVGRVPVLLPERLQLEHLRIGHGRGRDGSPVIDLAPKTPQRALLEIIV